MQARSLQEAAVVSQKQLLEEAERAGPLLAIVAGYLRMALDGLASTLKHRILLY